MDQETLTNYVVLTIVLGALAVGGLSMLFGRLVDLYDSVRAWWSDGIELQRARYEARAPLYGLRDMSTYEDEEEDETADNSIATTTPQNSNNRVATPQNASNDLLLQAKAEALAAMVKAGKIGETDGIKMVFGVSPSSSNPRYQAARAALKAELAKLERFHPARTPDQDQRREALGLSK